MNIDHSTFLLNDDQTWHWELNLNDTNEGAFATEAEAKAALLDYIGTLANAIKALSRDLYEEINPPLDLRGHTLRTDFDNGGVHCDKCSRRWPTREHCDA